MPLATSKWPLPFDLYILRFGEGSEILPHKDKVSTGNHHRVNVVLKSAEKGGTFICKDPIFESKRIKYFRPDISVHEVTKVEKVIAMSLVLAGLKTHNKTVKTSHKKRGLDVAPLRLLRWRYMYTPGIDQCY